MIEEDKFAEVFHRVQNAQKELHEAKAVLDRVMEERRITSSDLERRAQRLSMDREGSRRIIEGVFNGEQMVGPDGKCYTIPANYASKSKLVEGDILKLTIQEDGSFIYKQIGPVKRSRKVGILTCREDRKEFTVLADGKTYRVLHASVTYYKGEAGDQTTIIVPEDGNSEWAAIENLIRSKELDEQRLRSEEPATKEMVHAAWGNVMEQGSSDAINNEKELEKIPASSQRQDPWSV